MNNKHWEEPREEDGLTLGDEELLSDEELFRREVEKSKSLKIDRLRLRDEIEKLNAEKSDLTQKNRRLTERVAALENSSANSAKASVLPRKTVTFAVIFILLALLVLATRL